MKALVTGAAGFVGSAIARKLLDQGLDIRCMTRSSSDLKNLNGLDVELVNGDLLDRQSMVAALQGCNLLFHAAADYRLWIPDPDSMYKTNVEGTVNLMRAAQEAGVERIVYTSSVATLGILPGGVPADETTPSSVEDMIGHYKRSKFLAEQEVARMASEETLPVVIVNPSTPIGPGDIKPTPTGKLIQDAVTGRMPAYVDTGLNFVHVDDVADGHLLAWQKGTIGERYILGGEDLSLQQTLAIVADMTGRSAPKVKIPQPVAMAIAVVCETGAKIIPSVEPIATVEGVKMSRKKMYFSSAKAMRELEYSPRPVSEAIQAAVDWFSRK